MIERILTALIAVPAILALTYFGGFWFLFLVLAISLVALNEFYNLVKQKGFNPYYTVGNLFSALLLISTFFSGNSYLWERNIIFILTSAVIVSFCTAVFIRRRSQATANVSLTLLGVVFVGLLFSYLILIRSLTLHGKYLFMLMVVLWVSDTLAYFIGKTIGRHQLSQYISPKKTIEGAVAGLFGAILSTVAFYYLIEPNSGFEMLKHYLILGFFAGVLGQMSDLSESLIKRDVGAKDSSNIVPGHGGVLDRMDSFIFSAPFFYYYLKFFVMR